MRLFIALPLTKEARDYIGENLKEVIPVLGNKAKFIPDYKWHFTLIFLGNQPEDINPLKEAIQKAAGGFEKPTIELEKITYAPSRKKPRMVWLRPNKKSNEKMVEIKKELTGNLKKQEIEWKEDHREYNGHINLAKFELTFINELPEIEKEINFIYQPSSIYLIKSTLKPTGPEYETIFDSPFKNS